MQNIFKLAAVAAACTTSMAAQAAVGFDANLELDTTATNSISAPATNARKSDTTLGGRVELNVTGSAKSGAAFVASKATLLIKTDGTTAVDDMWVQVGNSVVDFKLGSFEATDLFPLGKDTLVEEAGYGGYKANALRGRFKTGTAAGNALQGALGLNAAPGLRLELGLVFTNNAGGVRGVRPAVTYTAGPLSLRAGVEAIQTNDTPAVAAAAATPFSFAVAPVAAVPGKNTTGFGVSAGYALNADSSININYAKRDDDKSIGLNGTFGAAGAGLIMNKGALATQDTTTVYLAYSLPLMGVKGASVTPALSFSRGGTGIADQTAFRVRVNYAF